MRQLILPTLPLVAVACTNDYGVTVDGGITGVMNPRPLEVTQQTDRLIQTVPPEVDVLWVVDDSCSMFDDQAAVSKHFPIFFEFFEGSGLDYHLGVVTTDMISSTRRGKLVTAKGYRWIDVDTPQAASVFEDFMPGTGGQFPEQGIDATFYGLEVEKNEFNLGFLRERSSVHIILISDEQDYSEHGNELVTPEELSAFLNGLRQDGDQVTFSSIALPNSKYFTVSGFVGGITHPILEGEWGTVLERLGVQAAGLKREYFLSQLPVPGTIDVAVKENETTYRFTEGEDWEYNPIRNSISFHVYVPNPMAEVLITYDILSSDHGD